MKLTCFPFLLLVLLGTCCQRYTNTRAVALFQKADAIAIEIAPKLTQLEQEKNNISIQGRALTGIEIQKIDQINTLLDRYAWFNDKHQPGQSLKMQQQCLETIQWIQQQLLVME